MDVNSKLDGMSDAVSSAIITAFDSYGWVIPALFLVLLFIGVLLLIAFALGSVDIDLDLPVFESVSGIFKWARETWRGNGSRSDFYPEGRATGRIYAGLEER
jgi:hypothetical protein